MELTTVAQAEDAWNDAFLAPTVEPMRLLLHPDFIAVHGPIGHIQDLDEFINDAAARPRPVEVAVLARTVREINDMATVSCIQELRIPFAPNVPPFTIQAAVTRVWVRDGGTDWSLAHLQMARRLPPG